MWTPTIRLLADADQAGHDQFLLGDLGRFRRWIVRHGAGRPPWLPPRGLNPLERARTKPKLAPGFLIRSAPQPRRVVNHVGT
jgi:hypothetical protein